jgi:hypothetical protein
MTRLFKVSDTLAILALLGSLGLAIAHPDARQQFSNLATAIVGGYYGAKLPDQKGVNRE